MSNKTSNEQLNQTIMANHKQNKLVVKGKTNYVIRFGYCPPNPGLRAKLYHKWFTKAEDAMAEYKGETIYISYNKQPYKQITFDELCEL